jgi:hypothetical protein
MHLVSTSLTGSCLRMGLAILALAVLAGAAASQSAKVETGVLTCNVYGGAGFVFGSSKDLSCVFEGLSGGKERYRGSIDKFGLDVGYTGNTVMVWTVLAPSAAVPSGALAGTYGGVSAEATVGLGVGANALLGGSKNSIALQPLSVQGQQGLNIALGVAELKLRAVR